MFDDMKFLNIVFGILFMLIIVLFINKRQLWKSKFSTINLIKEDEIQSFGNHEIVIDEEKQKAKKSYSIKINYIFYLVFAAPLLVFGYDMIINAIIRHNDIFISLITGVFFIYGGFMLSRKFILFCYIKLILLNNGLNIYKVEVFVADRHTSYHRDSDYSDYELYYVTLKDKNNLGIRKWYEISKKDSHKNEFILYYFKIKNKVFTSLVAK